MSITAILNAYRRPHAIQKQIDSLTAQSVKPDEIWVWRNNHSDWNIDLSTLSGVDKYCDSNYNWKYFGRLSFGMMAKTDFVAFFDDDTVPGNRWLENCLETYKESPGLLGGIGLVQLDTMNYMNHVRHGCATNNTTTTQVDLVGHAWFMPKIYLGLTWIEEPVTYETAEDMHLSYMLQKYGKINTYVPKQPKDDLSLSSSLYGYELGVDDKTESVTDQKNFFGLRDRCLRSYVARGWKLCQQN
jgi:hypothetical protein